MMVVGQEMSEKTIFFNFYFFMYFFIPDTFFKYQYQPLKFLFVYEQYSVSFKNFV